MLCVWGSVSGVRVSVSAVRVSVSECTVSVSGALVSVKCMSECEWYISEWEL